MRPCGFDSPLVHLLGLVYDAYCLLAFAVLLGRLYGVDCLGFAHLWRRAEQFGVSAPFSMSPQVRLS